MVLAEDLRRRLARRRKKEMEEAVKKATEEVRQKVTTEFQRQMRDLVDWSNRRLEAQQNNEPFDEPPPFISDEDMQDDKRDK